MYRLRPQTVYFQIEFIVPAHAFEIYYSHHGFLSKYPLSESISISIKAPMRFTRIRLCFPSVCRDAITISDAAKLQFRDRWNNFAAVCVCVCVLEREDTSFRIVHVTHIENVHNRRGSRGASVDRQPCAIQFCFVSIRDLCVLT